MAGNACRSSFYGLSKIMIIKNIFSQNLQNLLADEIYSLIKKDGGLAVRDLVYLRKKIAEGGIFIAFEKNKITGFIIKEKLPGNYRELRSWLVVPQKRGEGVGRKLLDLTVQEKNKIYLLASFNIKAVRVAKSVGFEEVALFKLTPKILMYYLLTRKPHSYLRHIFKEKSVILIK